MKIYFRQKFWQLQAPKKDFTGCRHRSVHAYSAIQSLISAFAVKSSWFVQIKHYADVYSEVQNVAKCFKRY